MWSGTWFEGFYVVVVCGEWIFVKYCLGLFHVIGLAIVDFCRGRAVTR